MKDREGFSQHDHQGEIWKCRQRYLEVEVRMGGEENPPCRPALTARVEIHRDGPDGRMRYQFFTEGLREKSTEAPDLSTGLQERQSRSGTWPEPFPEWRWVLHSLHEGIACTLASSGTLILASAHHSPLQALAHSVPLPVRSAVSRSCLGTHSCCPRRDKKIICIICLGGHFQFLLYLLGGIVLGGSGGFCSGSQVGRDLFHLPSCLSSPFPSPLSNILVTHSQILSADWDDWDPAYESGRDTSNWNTLGLIFFWETRESTASALSCIIFDTTESQWSLE